ncbi:uncharacterized protein LOC118435012 [Folsomia candida]|nr:uncharacterized protein LOC118435012 [Folsomia candida]
MNRRRANSYSPIMPNPSGGDEIVCSTGELMNLKCLSRSAMEMRALQSHEFGPDLGTAARRGSMFHASTTTTGNNNYANHQRSLSFDDTVAKKSPGEKSNSNLLTGLLNRIKAGVAGGGGGGVSPPIETDIEGCSTSTSTSTHAPPTTPVATTVLLDPSGCGPTITTLSPTPISSPRVPSSQDRSPANEAAEEQRRGSGGGDGKTGIPWDNNTGYFLDASILGLAIENHLKNGDNKGQRRRATFCTLSETNDQLLGQPTSLGGQTLGTPTNRPRSASAYSVLPFHHSSGGGPIDPEMISRRRESIASVFPPTSSRGFPPQGRRNSSFTSQSGGAGGGGEPNFYCNPHEQQEEVIVGSFIKTSMTSELYGDEEVIVEEEQLDIENYDNQTPQNVKNFGKFKSESSSSFLGGIDFWNNKPTETIINLFSSATTNLKNSSERNDRRFSFGSQSNHRESVATINEEDEDSSIGGGGGGGSAGNGGLPHERQNTFCGFFRNIIMQIIHSLFRS